MDTEIKNELTKILQSLSDKYSNVKFNSKDLSLNIFGSKNIMDSKRINCIEIDFKNEIFKIKYDFGDENSSYLGMSEFINLKWKDKSIFLQSALRKGDYIINGSKIGTYGHKFKNEVQPVLLEIQQNIIPAYNNIIENRKKLKEIEENKRLNKLHISQNNVLSELDKDGNGEIDVIEGNDFNLLLKKHQKTIVEVDRNYVQQFVKVSSYLKTKKGNIQSIFNSIKDTPNQEVLNEYVEILKGEIHTYNLVLFNSLNMIVSLVEDDMITFYEIYEMFDTINMFDSKHEKDVSQKLTNIGDGLERLMHEIRVMGNKITNSIQELSYVTEQSNQQLTEQLSEIDSTMKVGNLISTINTYQNYKINKNTKSLRG